MKGEGWGGEGLKGEVWGGEGLKGEGWGGEGRRRKATRRRDGMGGKHRKIRLCQIEIKPKGLPNQCLHVCTLLCV